MATHWAIYVPVHSSISTLLMLQSIPSAGSEGSSSSSAVSEVLVIGQHGGASTIDDASGRSNMVVDDNRVAAMHTCNKGGIIESHISISRVNDFASHPHVPGGL